MEGIWPQVSRRIRDSTVQNSPDEGVARQQVVMTPPVGGGYDGWDGDEIMLENQFRAVLVTYTLIDRYTLR